MQKKRYDSIFFQPSIIHSIYLPLLCLCAFSMVLVSCSKKNKSYRQQEEVDTDTIFHREEKNPYDREHTPSNNINNNKNTLNLEFSTDVPIESLSINYDEIINGLHSNGIHVTGMTEGSSVSLHKGDCEQHEDDIIYSDGTLMPTPSNHNLEQKLYIKYTINGKYNCKELSGLYVYLLPPTIILDDDLTNMDRRIPHFHVGDLFKGKQVTVSLHNSPECSDNSISELLKTDTGSATLSVKKPLRETKFKDYYAKQSYKGVSSCSHVVEYAKGIYPEFYMFNHDKDYARSFYMNQNRGIIIKNTTMNHTLKIYTGLSCNREDKLVTTVKTLGGTTLVETPSLEDGNYIFSFLELDSNGNTVGCYKTPEVKLETKRYISNEFGTIKINDSKKSIKTITLIEQTQEFSKTIKHIYSTKKAFAILFTDGSVKVAGDSNFGGSANNYADYLNGSIPVVSIYQTEAAFAALRADGSVVSWGDASSGGSTNSPVNATSSLTSGVKTIFANSKAFAALKSDGSVVTWGKESYGGDSGGVAAELSEGVFSIFSTLDSFVALKEDGSLISWGNNNNYVPNIHSAKFLISSQQSVLGLSPDGTLLTGGTYWYEAPYDTHHIEAIYTTEEAYSALFENGSVITWGGYNGENGGNSSSVANLLNGDIPVVEIFSTTIAFAALRSDGSLVIWGSNKLGQEKTETHFISGDIPVMDVYTSKGAFLIVREDGSFESWGDPDYGGNISSDLPTLTNELSISYIQSQSTGFYVKLSDGTVIISNEKSYVPENKSIVQVSYNYGAVATLLSDGSVSVWGDSNAGGDISKVSSKLDGTIKVVGIYPQNDTNISVSSHYPQGAFAALREDGSVITWGEANYGGDSSAVSSKLDGSIRVTSILATRSVSTQGMAFAALREDGSVITWGDANLGGDSSQVSSLISSNVKALFSTSGAFAALKNDGSVVTWGDSYLGGDSSSVSIAISSDVENIYSNLGAFVALKTNGSVVAWGNPDCGGNIDIQAQLDGTIKVISVFSMLNCTKSFYGVTYMGAFAALRDDGSIVVWGKPSTVETGNGVTSVEKIYSNNTSFVALKTTGELIAWGPSDKGGNLYRTYGGNPVNAAPSTQNIAATMSAFATILTNGVVASWGYAENGGDMTSVKNILNGSTPKAVSLYATSRAFAALRENGSVVTWGNKSYGGDSSSVSSKIDGTVPVVKLFSLDRLGFLATRSDGTNVHWSDKQALLF